METGILERMKLIMSYYKLSERAFAIRLGLGQTTLNSIFKRNNDDVKLTTITLILNSFPDIDESWLVTGKGEMLRSASKSEQETNNDKIKMLEDKIAEYEHRLKEYESMVSSLQYTIELQKGIMESQRIAMQIMPNNDGRSAIQQKIGQLEVIINDIERTLMVAHHALKKNKLPVR